MTLPCEPGTLPLGPCFCENLGAAVVDEGHQALNWFADGGQAVGGTFSWRRRSSSTGSPASPLAALLGLTKSGSSSKSKQSPTSPTGDATASSRSIGAHADSGRKTAVQFQQSSVQDHSVLEQTGGALGDCAEESESVSGSHESPTSLSTGQNPDHGAPSSTLSSPHESVLVWSRFVAGADFGSKEEDGESITAGGLQSSEDRSPIQQLSSDEYDGEVMSPVPKDGSSIKTKKKRGLKAGMGSLARAMSTRLRRQSGKEGTRKGSVEHSFQGDIEVLHEPCTALQSLAAPVSHCPAALSC